MGARPRGLARNRLRRRRAARGGGRLSERHTRTARFYDALLGGGEAAWLREIEATAVELTVDGRWILGRGAQRLLVHLVNIAARSVDAVSVSVLGGDPPCTIDPVLVASERTIGMTARALERAIAGDCAARHARVLRLHVGPRPSRRWIAAVGARGWRGIHWPAGCAPSAFEAQPNAVGAMTGALIGGAALTRMFIASAIAEGGPSVDARLRDRYSAELGSTEISIWDLFHDRWEPDWRPADVGYLLFASMGAVNGALLTALLLAGDVSADVLAYDSEALETHNLNRYLYASLRDVGRAKVEVAHRLCRGRPIRLAPRNATIQRAPTAGPEVVVVSGVDNDDARHAAQRLAPDRLLSLATALDTVEMSMHRRGRGACLGCLHPGDVVTDPLQPTHPVVSGWAGLLGIVALLRPAEWAAGAEVRLQAFDPARRQRDDLRARTTCTVCADGSVARRDGEAA